MKKQLLASMIGVLLASSAWAQSASQSEALSKLNADWDNPQLFTEKKEVAVPDLNALMADQIKSTKDGSADSIPPIRATAIKQTAASLGARAGLAKRLKEYEVSLEKRKGYVESIFNFSSVALSVPMDSSKPATYPDPRKGNGEYAMVLPAVLLDGHDADSFPNDDEARIADRVYKVFSKERLIPVDKKTGQPVVPTWRDYVELSFTKLEMPSETMFPQNDAEKALWNKYLKEGWEKGKVQADEMFAVGMAHMKRDFNGMLRGRLAKSEGRMTETRVSGVNMGVTGGGNEMRINDRVVKIVGHSTLVAEPSKWVPNPDAD